MTSKTNDLVSSITNIQLFNKKQSTPVIRIKSSPVRNNSIVMKKVKRFLILGSLFIIPLLSLGQDVSSVSYDLSKAGANIGSSDSTADGIIIALVLIFSYEVYKFFLEQKKLREREKLGLEN